MLPAAQKLREKSMLTQRKANTDIKQQNCVCQPACPGVHLIGKCAVWALDAVVRSSRGSNEISHGALGTNVNVRVLAGNKRQGWRCCLQDDANARVVGAQVDSNDEIWKEH